MPRKRRTAPAAPPDGVRARVVPLSELVPDPGNARLHPERNRSAIRTSLERFGAARSLVVDATGTVRAGSGTLQEALDAGITEALVVEVGGDVLVAVRRSDWGEEEARAYALVDNRASELSRFDPAALAAALAALGEHGWSTSDLGWEPWEADPLLTATAVGDSPPPGGEGQEARQPSPRIGVPREHWPEVAVAAKAAGGATTGEGLARIAAWYLEQHREAA